MDIPSNSEPGLQTLVVSQYGMARTLVDLFDLFIPHSLLQRMLFLLKLWYCSKWLVLPTTAMGIRTLTILKGNFREKEK